MKSIYQELLDIANKDMMFMPMTIDEFCGENEADYEDDEIDDNLIYMPLERTFLLGEDGRQVDVTDFHHAICNIPFTEKQLEKYADGDVYKGYPIAVSFLIDKKLYMQNLDILMQEGLALVSYTNGTCFSFVDGVEIFETSAGGDAIRVVMGFAKQGVLEHGELDDDEKEA